MAEKPRLASTIVPSHRRVIRAASGLVLKTCCRFSRSSRFSALRRWFAMRMNPKVHSVLVTIGAMKAETWSRLYSVKERTGRVSSVSPITASMNRPWARKIVPVNRAEPRIGLGRPKSRTRAIQKE